MTNWEPRPAAGARAGGVLVAVALFGSVLVLVALAVTLGAVAVHLRGHGARGLGPLRGELAAAVALGAEGGDALRQLAERRERGVVEAQVVLQNIGDAAPGNAVFAGIMQRARVGAGAAADPDPGL